MSARPLLVAIAVLSAFTVSSPSVSSAAIVCPAMPDPITKVNKDVVSDIQVSVGTLGRLKAGEVKTKTEVVAKNLFDRYPNTDRLLVIQMMAATYCSMIKDSTSISENDRQKLWARFQEKAFSLVDPNPNFEPKPERKTPQKPVATSAREMLGTIGDTGWIFVGYYEVDSGLFIEGPYASVQSKFRSFQSRPSARFMEIGNTITLAVSRKVYVVNYRKTGAEFNLKSPIVKGIIDKDDETGITLPPNTKLTVRDVSEGKWEDNPNAGLWVRVVAVAE